MPTYDYYCADNDQTIEVKHGMNEKMFTWGELCEKANVDLGDTSLLSPVQRLATGGNIVKRSSIGHSDAPPCSIGGGCPSGGCGI